MHHDCSSTHTKSNIQQQQYQRKLCFTTDLTKDNGLKTAVSGDLRTFARKFSNIDFFLKILPLIADELVMSEIQKNWGLTDFVLERTCPEEHLNLSKLGFVSEMATVPVNPKILQLEL